MLIFLLIKRLESMNPKAVDTGTTLIGLIALISNALAATGRVPTEVNEIISGVAIAVVSYFVKAKK
ncbi:hypothetical protein PCC6912_39600 [Chlorogloeopsis fritschii PCC 6912]|uniref:Holin n=2 Tax=Chlorogloeopsis fritschii TaxID=1124 RepID=A0A3S0XNU4_CHLFR|nr:hypothetical protein PCC6912_39600 [Chlorogloeopsis fritschii PCC 6912]